MPDGRLSPARLWPLLPLLIGAGLLVAAEFMTLYEIRAITAVPDGGTQTSGEHHGYALAVVGLALAAMAWGAIVGGSRPAALAVAALAAVALLVVLAIDLPDVNDEGLIGERYEQAEARPQSGFYLESAGAVLALIGAVSLFLFPAQREKGRHATRRSQEGHEARPAVRAHQGQRQEPGQVGVDRGGDRGADRQQGARPQRRVEGEVEELD